MKQALGYSGLAFLLYGASVAAVPAAELPARYFRLMEAELKPLQPATNRTTNNGAMLAAAVLYKKQHPANPSFADKQKLELALALGDLAASLSEKDTAENKQDYEWEIHFWLDSYRLLEAELGAERRARWRKEIEKIVSWFARETAGRIDFPRYQGPYIRTSTNHLALFASTTYLAGRVLPNQEWETLGARALHRLAAEEQTADGYWGEFTDNGPATGYNYLTLCCVALYWEHSRDPAALEALRRATEFHEHFTWPDGTPVETINGRNRHWSVSAWGHFGFTHWPAGRRYAEFLAGFFTPGHVSSRDLGRIAQSALYCHEGPTAPIPQDLPRSAYQMKVPAGIRKTGPWVVCLSGLIDTPIDSQFTLDRQGHLSIYHERLGLIVTGANSKHQPELATFTDKAKDRVITIPYSSRLRMSDERDRLGLGYHTFFAEIEVPTPSEDRLPFRFAITETGRGRLQEAQLNLQLCLKAGESLETAKTKIVLGEQHVELGPDQIGGWVRHRGWTLRVDPSARLVWPIRPFNPYRNAPETDLRYAVGALSVPVQVQPPPEGGLNWRRGVIAFALEANPTKEGGRQPPRPAATPELPGDRAIRKYLAGQAAALERELLPGIRTAAELEKARPALRADYLDMLGLKPLPERTPLKVTVTGRLERDGYTVEKLHFQSRPGLYVTANLYLPRPAHGRSPAILYLCGHASQMKRDGTKAAADHQSHAIWFATHGYVALVLDTLELGEIAALHRGTLSQNRWWWHSAGYTPAGVECWNAMRGIDYLISRPEADPDRIGATGISGGGIGTFWVAAADERVKAAAPVSGLGDLTFAAGEGGVGRHCDCIFLYNRARWSGTAVAALICPRPLLFVNSDNDVYFPMSSNERVANRLQRLYSLFGAGDQAPAMVSVGGHGYRTDIRRAVFEFFNRHFKGDARRVTDADAAEVPRGQFPIDPHELRVFPTDADLPADQLNTRIDETFVARARPELPSTETFEAWRRDLLDRLRKASFAAWPAQPPDGPVPALGSQPAEGRETTEEGIDVYWHWSPGQNSDGMRWLIVLNPGEEAAQLPAWARDLVGGGPALLLCPRGVGPGAWTRNVFPNTVERSFPLLGGTADGGRVWDVMTIARRHAREGARWRAAGQGQAGVVAAYAALYEPAIAEVVAVDPPPSHQPRSAGVAYGPALLNVLRVLDIPDALGCLAPRRLVLIGAPDAAFDRTDALYRRVGAADRLEHRPGRPPPPPR
jgi:cephalosporin-C deacetylase-like acetyl esterase